VFTLLIKSFESLLEWIVGAVAPKMAAMDSAGFYLERTAGYQAIDLKLESANTLDYCHGIVLQTSVFQIEMKYN
jgi:hypothetical protein